MKKFLFALIFAVSCFGQATVNLPALTVSAEAVAALNAWLPAQLSGITTTLTAPVLVGDTVINVASTAGIAANSGFVIDSEAFQVTAKTVTTFTVTRAIYGTTATAHIGPGANPVTPGVAVSELKYSPSGPTMLNNLFRRILADTVAQIMQTVGTPAVNAARTAITNANATIDSTVKAGVQ